MNTPVNGYLAGAIIPRSAWTQTEPRENHAPLNLPLKGVIVHHTGNMDHQCNQSGKIFCIHLKTNRKTISRDVSYKIE